MPPIYRTDDDICYTSVMHGPKMGFWRAWCEHSFIERPEGGATFSQISPFIVQRVKAIEFFKHGHTEGRTTL